jgi:hypothetical protein
MNAALSYPSDQLLACNAERRGRRGRMRVAQWDLFILIADEEPSPSADYAIAIGTIAGGLGRIRLAQALRLLLEIRAKR